MMSGILAHLWYYYSVLKPPCSPSLVKYFHTVFLCLCCEDIWSWGWQGLCKIGFCWVLADASSHPMFIPSLNFCFAQMVSHPIPWPLLKWLFRPEAPLSHHVVQVCYDFISRPRFCVVMQMGSDWWPGDCRETDQHWEMQAKWTGSRCAGLLIWNSA